MSVKDVLASLTRAGVRLTVAGDDLKVYTLKGALPNELRAAISAAKPALVAALRAEGGGPIIPLAAFEERLIHAYANPNFNIAGMFRLQGDVDLRRLERAFAELALRNDALRMTFPRVDGHLCARIEPAPSLGFEVTDLTHLSAAEQEARVDEIAKKTRDEGVFDFVRGPLLRLQVLKCGPTDHVVVFVTNHATQDGISVEYIFADVALLYAGKTPPRRAQFSDALLVEQNEYVKPIDAATAATWSKKYEGKPAPFTLARPDAKPASPRQGEHVEVDIEPDVVARLRAVAAADQSSLATMLVAVFELTIARTTHADDILHGLTAFNRSARAHDAIGSFGKGNPCRFVLRGARSVRDVMARANEEIQWLLDNDSPRFTRWIAESKFSPTLVNFNYVSMPAVPQAIDLPGVRSTPMRLIRKGTHTHPMLRDMALFIVNRADGGLLANCAYDLTIHDGAMVRTFLDTYRRMLLDLAERPKDVLAAAP